MFRKARQGSLVEDMVAQIEEAIVSGSVQPGDKLPSSRELEETLGASRGTLREALRILEQKGLIEVKVGVKGGIFVREVSTEPVTESLGLLIRQLRIQPWDLAEFRQVVESGLIRRVIAKASGRDMAALKKLLADMETCSRRGPEGWAGLLAVEVKVRKKLIAIADHKMYEAVLIPIHENIFAYTDHYLPGREGITEEAFKDWRDIIFALEAKDEDRAVAGTVSHIARFTEHFMNGNEDRKQS